MPENVNRQSLVREAEFNSYCLKLFVYLESSLCHRWMQTFHNYLPTILNKYPLKFLDFLRVLSFTKELWIIQTFSVFAHGWKEPGPEVLFQQVIDRAPCLHLPEEPGSCYQLSGLYYWSPPPLETFGGDLLSLLSTALPASDKSQAATAQHSTLLSRPSN